jgi:phosphonopyruvate decarboxylase
MKAKKLIETLRDAGCEFFTGVPDSLLKDFSFELHGDPNHVVGANEGNSVAIAMGYHLATGKVPVVYMQNSGLGNSVNPLLSLADGMVYGIPMLCIVGWRGRPGTADEPQHKKQGLVTDRIIDAMGYHQEVLSEEESEATSQIGRLLDRTLGEGQPVFLLVGRALDDLEAPERATKYPLSRKEALHNILGRVGPDSLIVSTTGKLSREVFEYREMNGQAHEDFLVVGGMGHCSQISLGVALKTDRRVYCLDGDGSVLMHMGGLATIGRLKPRNLTHIVFNNGCHESVGGQATCSPDLALSEIAKICGYPVSRTVLHPDEAALGNDRLTFLEVMVGVSNDKKLCRPNVSNVSIKNNFMKKSK